MEGKITICVCALLLMAAIPAITGQVGSAETIPQQTRNSYITSEPFRINSNADFATSPKVAGGDGSAGSPWIIENYEIDGTGHGYCIYIGNTTDYFVVKNCYLHEASGVDSWPYYPDSGLTLYRVQNGRIANNIANLNNGIGIYLQFSHGNAIADNNGSSNKWAGIYVHGSNSNTIANNTIASNNDAGISLSESSSNTIAYNTAISNHGRGIFLTRSSGNTITNNTAKSNIYDGIWLGESSSNTIAYNNASSNNYNGIWLEESSGNTIACNNVSNNWIGIRFESSSSNTIYHNNFINNSIQAYDDSTNNWDNGYPGGGNYWSDYNGTDNMNGPGQDIPGSDGIGDTPFIVIQGDSGAQDNYPLMEPFTPSDAGGGDEKTPGFTFMTVLAAALIALCIISLNGRRKRTPPGI